MLEYIECSHLKIEVITPLQNKLNKSKAQRWCWHIVVAADTWVWKEWFPDNPMFGVTSLH